MFDSLKLFFVVLILASLAACISPRYQTAYRYEAPTDAAGRACLTQCEPKSSHCKTQCAEKHQACVKDLDPQIEARFAQKTQQYQRDFHYYLYALELYQRRLSLGFYSYDPRYAYYYGYEPSFPPIPPFKPSREQIAAQLVQQQCDRDCGCQTIYDACFLGCGGKKIPEVKCVAHCAPEK